MELIFKTKQPLVKLVEVGMEPVESVETQEENVEKDQNIEVEKEIADEPIDDDDDGYSSDSIVESYYLHNNLDDDFNLCFSGTNFHGFYDERCWTYHPKMCYRLLGGNDSKDDSIFTSECISACCKAIVVASFTIRDQSQAILKQFEALGVIEPSVTTYFNVLQNPKLMKTLLHYIQVSLPTDPKLSKFGQGIISDYELMLEIQTDKKFNERMNNLRITSEADIVAKLSSARRSIRYFCTRIRLQIIELWGLPETPDPQETLLKKRAITDDAMAVIKETRKRRKQEEKKLKGDEKKAKKKKDGKTFKKTTKKKAEKKEVEEVKEVKDGLDDDEEEEEESDNDEDEVDNDDDDDDDENNEKQMDVEKEGKDDIHKGEKQTFLGRRASHPQNRTMLDMYESPENILNPLLFTFPELFSQPLRIWECCCGLNQTLVRRMMSLGKYQVYASDINDAIQPPSNIDFLNFGDQTVNLDSIDIIITNPPFGALKDFIYRALTIKKPFAFIVPLDLLGRKWFAEIACEYPNNMFGVYPIIPRPTFRDASRDKSIQVGTVCWFIGNFQYLSVELLKHYKQRQMYGTFFGHCVNWEDMQTSDESSIQVENLKIIDITLTSETSSVDASMMIDGAVSQNTLMLQHVPQNGNS